MKTKRFSRRDFLQWSLMAAGATTLAACTPAAPPTEAPKPTESAATPVAKNTEAPTAAPAAAEAVEVEYFTYDLGQANKSREDLGKAFHEANPNISMKLTSLPYGDNWTKLAALVASGTPPDVIYGDFSLLRMALEGQLLELSDYMKLDPVLSKPELFTIDMNDAIQAKFGTQKVYNLILGTWVPVLYYNKDIFDAAKEPYPDETWTWDKVRDAAKRLTQPDKQQYGFQFGTTLDHVGWLWWEQKPADFWAVPQIYPDKTAFDSDTGKNVMSVYHNFGSVDKTMMPFSEAGSYQAYGAAFGAGKAAMYSGGDWDAGWGFRELKFKWDMTFIPQMKAGYRPSLNTMVATSAIAKGSKHPDQAWKLAQYISATKEGQTFIGQGAYETPVLKEVAHSDAVMKPGWAVPGYGTRVKAAELTGPMYTPYQLSLNLWEFSDKFLSPTVEKLTTGEMKPEEATAYLDKEGIPYFTALNQELLKIHN